MDDTLKSIAQKEQMFSSYQEDLTGYETVPGMESSKESIHLVTSAASEPVAKVQNLTMRLCEKQLVKGINSSVARKWGNGNLKQTLMKEEKKNAAKELTKQQAKQAAKKMGKEAIKEVSKEGAKETSKVAAKEGVRLGMEATTTLIGTELAPGVGTLIGYGAGSIIGYGMDVADTAMDGPNKMKAEFKKNTQIEAVLNEEQINNQSNVVMDVFLSIGKAVTTALKPLLFLLIGLSSTTIFMWLPVFIILIVIAALSCSVYGLFCGADALNTNSITTYLNSYNQAFVSKVDTQYEDLKADGYRAIYQNAEKETLSSNYNNSNNVMYCYLGKYMGSDHGVDCMQNTATNKKRMKKLYKQMCYYEITEDEKGKSITVTYMTWEEAAEKGVITAEEKEAIVSLQSAMDTSGFDENFDTLIYCGNMVWPCTSTTITSKFGYRSAPTAGASSYHKGVDIALASGSKVYAAAAGTIETSAYDSSRGNYIIVDHGNGMKTIYEHLTNSLVSKGTVVTQGSAIGISGSTGVSTGPHLHFGVISNGDYINPLQFYPDIS